MQKSRLPQTALQALNTITSDFRSDELCSLDFGVRLAFQSSYCCRNFFGHIPIGVCYLMEVISASTLADIETPESGHPLGVANNQ